MTLSVLLFVIMSLLLSFSNLDPSMAKKQISLLSYIYNKYSYKETYSIIDFSKSILIFFISIYSICLLRLRSIEINDELRFKNITKHIKFDDIFVLLGILILCFIFDYLLFQLDSFCNENIKNYSINSWMHNVNLYILRVYLPLALFSISIYKRTINKGVKITFKLILLLLISLWLINEFMYEYFSFVRIYLFKLILAPFEDENKFIYESILGVFLVATAFLGYFSGMTKVFLYFNTKE